VDYKIRENSLIAKIAALKLGTSSVAIVVGKTIYLHNTSKDSFLANPRWVKHELAHIKQFAQYGFFGFISSYLWESIRHGYTNNKYEKEARAAEEDTLPPG
jgi:hypothetical protein